MPPTTLSPRPAGLVSIHSHFEMNFSLCVNEFGDSPNTSWPISCYEHVLVISFFAFCQIVTNWNTHAFCHVEFFSHFSKSWKIGIHTRFVMWKNQVSQNDEWENPFPPYPAFSFFAFFQIVKNWNREFPAHICIIMSTFIKYIKFPTHVTETWLPTIFGS